MSIRHYEPGEVVDLRPLKMAIPSTPTRTLIKTKSMELIRMVMPAGKEITEHKAPGEMVIQCLEGRIEFSTMGKTETLTAGQLLYLAAREPHSVKCLEDASFLLTILLPG